MLNIMKIIFLLLLLIVNYICIRNYLNYLKNKKKYNYTIMAIFKNEEEYMEEWLIHHINNGFDKIYLYCNDPDISKYSYLLKYSKYVVLIDWTDKYNNLNQTIQRQAYYHCVQTYSQDCQFLLMLDLDEFIIPLKGFKKVSDYLDSLKSNWSNIKAFKIQRYNFGSNGHITKPIGSVVSNYKFHEKICSTYKTMANTDYIDKNKLFYGVHDFNFINKNAHIYNNYFFYENWFPNSCKENLENEIPLVINHYYAKSYDEYIKRCKLWKNGGINPIRYRTDCENKFKSIYSNDVEGY
jgi:hypothetical protein